jgi:hypothetical protein
MDLKIKIKKRGNCFFHSFHGFFLSINRTNTIATTMIRTNRAANAGTKYVSATDAGIGVGAAVAAGGRSYAMGVSAVELKYESLPLNAAMIV